MRFNFAKSAALAVVFCGFFMFENKSLTVSKYTVKSVKIPNKLNGLKIVQISDLQDAKFGPRNKRLINKIKSLKPDIIVITGDIIDCHRTDIYSALNFVKRISGFCPTYYVCGNHEGVVGGYEKLSGDIENMGAVVLNNRSVYFDEERKIRLIGLTDPYMKKLNNIGDFLKGQIGMDKKAFNIVLCHRPELFSEYCLSGADAAFCGHAHGGQIRIFSQGLFSPDQGILPKLTSGVHKNGGTTMIISRGLGNSVFPLRIFNRPEIVLTILERE